MTETGIMIRNSEGKIEEIPMSTYFIKNKKFLKLDEEILGSLLNQNYDRLNGFILNELDKCITGYTEDGKEKIKTIVWKLQQYLSFFESSRGLNYLQNLEEIRQKYDKHKEILNGPKN